MGFCVVFGVAGVGLAVVVEEVVDGTIGTDEVEVDTFCAVG